MIASLRMDTKDAEEGQTTRAVLSSNRGFTAVQTPEIVVESQRVAMKQLPLNSQEFDGPWPTRGPSTLNFPCISLLYVPVSTPAWNESDVRSGFDPQNHKITI